ncbi:MAG: hypothetical protein ACRELD_14540 [Longimicrobiales bacterium]
MRIRGRQPKTTGAEEREPGGDRSEPAPRRADEQEAPEPERPTVPQEPEARPGPRQKASQAGGEREG